MMASEGLMHDGYLLMNERCGEVGEVLVFGSSSPANIVVREEERKKRT
jgi:hypothetical protein